MELLKDLNKEQEAAVTHGSGPLLIIAGAGTGKTKVITHRIAWLIKEQKAKPDQILALTFTEKAAGEMADRLVGFDLPAIPPNISTFHAFGDSIMREYCYEFGLPSELRLLGEAEQVIFLEEILFDLPLEKMRGHGRPAKNLRALAKVFSRAKNENKSPADYEAWLQEEENRVAGLYDAEEHADGQYNLSIHREIAAAFKVYEAKKDERQLVDYADQVFKPTRLLEANKVIRERFRKQFKYILVDEYQDTNLVQSRLVDLIAGTGGNLNVVGDDDQSIFSFQGAAIRNILDFRKTHPKAEPVVLKQNYRSSQQILDAAYRLISHNADRLETTESISKKLESTEPEGPQVTLLRHATVDDEADRVADYIAKRRAEDESLPYAEMAILVRTKNLIEPFAQALAARGVPYLAEGTGKLFDRPEIKMAVNFLRTVVDPLDSASLKYLAGSASYQFPGEDMFRLARQIKLTHRPLWELLNELDPAHYSEKAIRVAVQIRDDIDHATKLGPDLPVQRLLFDWLDRVGFLKKLRAGSTPEAEAEAARQAQNLAKLFERLKQFARAAADPTAPGWIKHLDDIIALEDESVAAETDTDYDAVRIMTVHAAKGLEFGLVFLVACVAGRFPRWFKADAINCYPLLAHPPNRDNHLQEERRLFYVGMTRAKRELFLTAAADYHTKYPWKPSEFVAEALGPNQATTLPAAPSDPLKKLAQSRPLPTVATEYHPPEVVRLSFTTYSSYQDCPLKYYWEHVIGLRPEPSFTMQYGTIIHQVIQELNQAKQHGKKVTLEQLLAWYDDRWVGERFLSKRHEELVYGQGKQTLERFYKEEAERAPATAVEDRFEFALPDCLVEVKYDRIDRHGGAVTIVDYKTGEMKSQAEANKRVKQSEQLTLYALAHFEQFNTLPDRVVFNFVDAGISAVGTRTEADLEKMRQELSKVAGRIKQGDFSPSLEPHECSPFADCPGHRLTHRTEEAWR